jgi:hypothetical protein
MPTSMVPASSKEWGSNQKDLAANETQGLEQFEQHDSRHCQPSAEDSEGQRLDLFTGIPDFAVYWHGHDTGLVMIGVSAAAAI